MKLDVVKQRRHDALVRFHELCEEFGLSDVQTARLETQMRNHSYMNMRYGELMERKRLLGVVKATRSFIDLD